MDVIELSERLSLVRDRLHEIRQAVCHTGMAAQYHVARARDMVDDPEKVLGLTDLDSSDVSDYLSGLPATIERMIDVDGEANAIWNSKASQPGSMESITGTLMSLYESIRLHSRIYERLVRQPEKLLVEEAVNARSLSKRDARRRRLESWLRLDVEEYLRLESRIQRALEEIDLQRDAIADAHGEDADEYVRSSGRTDEMSLAAGRRGVRAAVNYYDERRGYDLKHYIGPWIDRELAKVGHNIKN